MKLVEIRKRVNQRSGLALGDDAVDSLINEALGQISDEDDWPWLKLTTTGTWTTDATTLDVPANVKAVRFLDVAGRTYRVMSAEQSATYLTDGDRAVGLSIENGTITPVPTPADAAAYTLHIIALEPPLTGDGDTPLIPDQWIGCVVSLAISMAHDRPEGNEKAGARAQARYDSQLHRMRRTVLKATRGAQVARARSDVI